MTDAFDVSLRVKLDYQAGGAARSAVADLGAIEATAKRLGAASSVLAVARDMGELRKSADVARAGLNDLAAAGGRLGQAGVPAKLATALGTVSDGAIAARRAIADTAEAAARLGTFNPGGKMAVEMDRAAKAAGSLEAEIDALVASAGKLTAWRPPQMEAAFRAIDAQAKSGRVQLGALEEAAANVGTATGPRHLGEGLAAVASGAAEARREVDFVGVAAAKATRDLDKMGAARAHAGSGGVGGEPPAHAAAAAGGRHAGPGGIRGALMAGARPLHMERLLASAMTPTGLMGLGAGLGLAGVAHEIEDATHRAIDLEDAMNRLRRTVGDISPERMKGLEGEILRTSRATGVGTGDLATMAATASAAGRPFAELPQFMDLGAKAAGALGIKADEAAGALTRIGADFKLDGGGLRGALDAVATLQERTGASGAGTLDFLSRVGPVAGLARLQPAQAAAFGGAMQQAGMSPDQSAGMFGDVLTKLLSGEKGGQGYMEGLHRMRAPDGDPESAFALQRLARVDPSAAMVRFLGDVKTLSKERRFNVLSEIVGPEQAEALSRMSEHVGELTRNLGLMQDTGAQRGGLERVFKLFDDATSKKIEHATAAVGAFATKIGQVFTPAVGAAADATSRFFGGWLDKMDRLEKVGEIAGKIAAGIAISPEDQKKLDDDPSLKRQVQGQVDAIGTARANDRVQSPGPEAGRQREMDRMGAAPGTPGDAGSARERDRLAMVENIRAEAAYARDHGGVGADDLRDLKAAYAAQFPDKPLPAFAGGGRARGPGGPTGDKILARVSDGEFIINARSTAKHLGTIKAINDDTLPAFATGGAVGALAMTTATGTADPAALDRLSGAVEVGVKAGVVAGLRDAEMRQGGRLVATAGGDAGSRLGVAGGYTGGSGFGGVADHHAAASIRYGRQHSGGGGGADVGGHASKMTGDVAARAKAGMARLEAKGWTHEAAAAAIGNAQQESGVRSDGPLGDTARFGTGDDAAHGMFQWRGQRFRDLKGFAADRGKAWTDFDTQLDFFDQESRKYGSAEWRQSHDVVQANRGMKRFEGYGDNSFGTRLANARQLAAGRTDGGFYPGAAGDVPDGVRAQGRATGPAGDGAASKAVDLAGHLDGMTSGQAGSALGSRMTPGEWCADFVNGALKAAGVRGSGSSMAMSFQNWGQHVGVDQVKRGDVIVENHGRGHGHVGLATGAVKRDADGKVVAIGMTSGNHGDKVVKDYWEKVGQITDLRRADEEVARAEQAKAAARRGPVDEDRRTRATAAERRDRMAARPTSPRFTDPGLKSAYDAPRSPGGGAGPRMSGGGGAGHNITVVQHFHGQHDPRETARHAQREANREITRARGRALHGIGALA